MREGYIFGLIILFLATFILRFINLGYSEFQDDEKKTRIVLNQQTNLIDFFLSQRKGPMQFLVAYVPLTYFQSNGYVNEFAVRLPFTVANFVTVFVLYALILKLTKSHLASFFVAFLFLVNGFVVGFSRIAQYQNLNLLFSITSLYFFSDFVLKKQMAKETPAPETPAGPAAEVPTAEQIAGAISAMRDSVWVITSEMEKAEITKEVVDAVGRNVGHLEIQMGNEHITGAGDKLEDVKKAITDGKAFIAEHQE